MVLVEGATVIIFADEIDDACFYLLLLLDGISGAGAKKELSSSNNGSIL